MVEIDLYSVIKQKYIERKVLDKIKEQIKSNLRGNAMKQDYKHYWDVSLYLVVVLIVADTLIAL